MPSKKTYIWDKKMKNLNNYISNDMKSFKTLLKESLLDDLDTLSKNADEGIKQEIKQFLKDNYSGASKCKISKHPDTDGKYIVDCKDSLIVIETSLKSLTNDRFKFGKVDGGFDCDRCASLTSLIGAPERVGGNFSCQWCKNLTSLVGAPKEVGENFDCARCDSLTSLIGAPEYVEYYFICCCCANLTSLDGAPKEVGGNFYCYSCKRAFTKEEVLSRTKVKNKNNIFC